MEHCVLLVTVSCFALWSHGEDQVRMTLLSINHFKSEEDAHFQCQMSSFENDSEEVTVKSLRTGWTRNTAEQNPNPPEAQYTDSDHHAYSVNMINNGTDKSFGVFGCNVSSTGKKETIISTTRMRSDADIVPRNGLFTKTVSIGDRNVSIRMVSTNEEVGVRTFRWRNNTYFWGQPHFGVDSFSIDGPIQLYHSGIYECHRAGDRHLAKHGLNLLIVRACPSTMWGPPDCEGVCDNCYNGGICDENNGACVCPPGFRGENCLEACGGNRYGYDCEYRCSYERKDKKSKCEGFLFCLIHPFGCRCNTGFRGLDCETECIEGSYGASCLQDCHCASGACNRYTGECEGTDSSCDPGWTGQFCQECDNGFFGTVCNQKCHCSSDKCNKESGLCKVGGCLPQWVDLFPPYSCQTGLVNASYFQVNQNISVQVNCTAVQGPGGDLNVFDVVLSKSSDDLEVTNISLNRTFLTGTHLTGYFTVWGLDQNTDLYCQLRVQSSGRMVAIFPVSVDFYELPALTHAPAKVTATNSSVTIRWSDWDENTDNGDPPIVGYIAYYKRQENGIWIPGGNVAVGEPSQFTFNGLDSDTNYLFSVATVREGVGGEGPRSPSLTIKTICADPLSVIEDVVANVAGERQELVEISWKHPMNDVIRCRSGLMHFNIYYALASQPLQEEISLFVNDSTATSYIISNLTVGEFYIFQLTLTTDGGESRRSNQTQHLIPVPPEISTSPNFISSNSTSITLSWPAWDNVLNNGTPPIVSYNLYHKLSNDSKWNNSLSYPAIEGQNEYVTTVQDLHPDTMYYFCVTAVREGNGGEGPKSPVLKTQTTIECKVPPSPENVVTKVSGERQQLVEITWKLPSDGNNNLGVTKFTIYSYSSETEKTSQITVDPVATSFILFNLTGGVSYTFFVTLTTSCGESNGSLEVEHLLPVLPSFTDGPSFNRVRCTSVTMVWTRWTHTKDIGTPPIVQYIPYHRKVSSLIWISGEAVTHSETIDVYETTFTDLAPDSIYEFSVAVAREGEGGEGDKYITTRQNTAYCPETIISVPTYIVAVCIGIPAAFTIVVAVLCSLRLIFRNNSLLCKSRPTETPDPHESIEAHYENAAFEDCGEYAAIGQDYIGNRRTSFATGTMKTFSVAERVQNVTEGEENLNLYEIPAVERRD